MINGVNPLTPVILATLGLSHQDVGRFRDVFVTDKDEIAVYTRNGGGNRASYQHVFDALAQHPCYLRDEDDSFDSTYATIYFKFPDEFATHLRSLSTGDFDPNAKWAEAIERIRGGDPELIAKFKPLMQAIDDTIASRGDQ